MRMVLGEGGSPHMPPKLPQISGGKGRSKTPNMQDRYRENEAGASSVVKFHWWIYRCLLATVTGRTVRTSFRVALFLIGLLRRPQQLSFQPKPSY